MSSHDIGEAALADDGKCTHPNEVSADPDLDEMNAVCNNELCHDSQEPEVRTSFYLIFMPLSYWIFSYQISVLFAEQYCIWIILDCTYVFFIFTHEYSCRDWMLIHWIAM